MRYYKIRITDPKSGATVVEYTSLNTLGQTIPGALNIELDIPVSNMAEPAGSAYVKIWGISLEQIGQAYDLNNKNIEVYAGMQKGLPLANPKQAGLILQGTISQAFGNWQGLEQSLDFVINAIGGSASDPKNIILNWKKGQVLGDAIKSALSTAFPEFQAEIKTSSKLVLNQDEAGYYETVTQFADYVKIVSQHILGKQGYLGVDILVQNKKFIVYDGSTESTPKEVQFIELIGQPTWIEFSKVNFKCVMRADLNVGDYVKLPQGQATVTANSFSQFRSKTAFSGVFRIDVVRHVGNFRQPDASSWATIYDVSVV
jgi:hypothetical protein